MEEQINLITTNKKKSPLKLGVFFNAALGFLIVTIIISVIITFITLSLNTQISSITTAQNEVVASYVSGDSNSKRLMLQTIHDRLLSIKEVRPSDKTLDKRLKLLVGLIPPGVEVQSFQIDSGTLDISVASQNLALIDDLFKKNLKQATQQKNSNIKKIVIDGFSLDKSTLTYLASIKIAFNSSL